MKRKFVGPHNLKFSCRFSFRLSSTQGPTLRNQILDSLLESLSYFSLFDLFSDRFFSYVGHIDFTNSSPCLFILKSHEKEHLPWFKSCSKIVCYLVWFYPWTIIMARERKCPGYGVWVFWEVRGKLGFCGYPASISSVCILLRLKLVDFKPWVFNDWEYFLLCFLKWLSKCCMLLYAHIHANATLAFVLPLLNNLQSSSNWGSFTGSEPGVHIGNTWRACKTRFLAFTERFWCSLSEVKLRHWWFQCRARMRIIV